MKKTEYKASGKKEIFLQFVNKDNLLFGLLRLRLQDDEALVRELHVYGKSEEIGKKGFIQHTGLGKKLMKEAEKIARQNKCKEMKVISGVGVREYYRKLGYQLKGEYMIKNLEK